MSSKETSTDMSCNVTLDARPGLDTTSSQFTGPTKAELNLTSKHDEALLQLPDTFAKEVLFLSVICSSQLLTQAGLAMSIVPSHIIGASFDIQNQSELSWFSAAYSLTIGTFILVAGRLGDVLGQKPFIVSGYLWFGIWSALAGLGFLEVLRGHSPLLTTAMFIPICVSGLCAAIATGLALTHLRASTVMLIAMAAFFVGGIIYATMPVEQTYWAQTFVGTVILPWGMDISFPSATIIMSRTMPQRHQGLAASLVNTFVNYSISIGLGFGGTVERQVNRAGSDILRDYRGAFYTGVGFPGLGVATALAFCCMEHSRSKASELKSPGTSIQA
ncbi:hypothetical protein LTR86_011126 [Recurvomyces mirabilis]|nr:hypothetical protein LTR86_011126 [Recurvomyces mirabilis]